MNIYKAISGKVKIEKVLKPRPLSYKGQVA